MHTGRTYEATNDFKDLVEINGGKGFIYQAKLLEDYCNA